MEKYKIGISGIGSVGRYIGAKLLSANYHSWRWFLLHGIKRLRGWASNMGFQLLFMNACTGG
jgi:hypothetical protein